MNHDANLHLSNIIKLQYLVHNQSSPRYINLFKYSWHKSEFTDARLGELKNIVAFSFGDSRKTHCEVQGCINIVILCS